MRALLVLAALSLTLTLTGCGGSEPSEPAAATLPPEDAFLASLKAVVPAYSLRSDRDRWVDLGYESCETLDNGQDDAWVAAALVSVRALEAAEADAVVAGAREHLCPEVP